MNPPQPRTLRPLTELKNWEQNPRNISQDGFKRLKSQIELLGQYKPLLVMPDGTVLGGNMRLRAYQELVITNPEKYGSVWVSTIDLQPQADELWSAFLDGMPQAKRFKTRSDGMMEYALSDNDRAGYYDSDLMANLMPEFNVDWSEYAADFNAPVTLETLLENTAPVDETPTPEVDELNPPISQLGEIYQLGRHRLMCGDATKIEDVEKLMNGQKADMVFTDPPYGIKYQSNWKNPVSETQIKGDEAFILEWIQLVDIKSGYICCRFDSYPILYHYLLSCGYSIFNALVWDKQSHTAGDLSSWANTYEMIIYYGKEKTTTARKQNVLRIRRLDNGAIGIASNDNMQHPTQKPVQLMAEIFEVEPAKNIIDLFGGSGSTLIACEQLNRTCYMMELDPKYCDVIRKRYALALSQAENWVQFTPVITQ